MISIWKWMRLLVFKEFLLEKLTFKNFLHYLKYYVMNESNFTLDLEYLVSWWQYVTWMQYVSHGRCRKQMLLKFFKSFLIRYAIFALPEIIFKTYSNFMVLPIFEYLALTHKVFYALNIMNRGLVFELGLFTI